MKVRDVIDIQNNKMPNMEKAQILARTLKARARKYNPMDTDAPIGWNASPYGGSPFSRSGGALPA